MSAWFELELRRGDLDEAIITRIVDAARVNVAARLQIDVSGLRGVRVVVADDANTVVDHEIRVAPRPSGGGYSIYDWFELLFTHELTHLIVRDTWGMPAALWWEGMPVHLGDDAVRSRLFGGSYHAYCGALAELGALLSLESLLRGSTYYRRRPDFRVDLQAGSFCGFLLETFGPRRLGHFIAESPRPVSEPAVAIVDPGLRRHFGNDLRGLQAAWVQFLATRVASDRALIERLSTRRFGEEPDAVAHCDHCFAHLRSIAPSTPPLCASCAAMTSLLR